TVGRSCVRVISRSRSTSYQLFKITAPAIISVLPIIVIINVSISAINEAFVNSIANQKPVNIGNTVAISTIDSASSLNTSRKVDNLKFCTFILLLHIRDDLFILFTLKNWIVIFPTYWQFISQ